MSFVQVPLLLQFLVNKSTRRGESAHYPSILMALSVILKERNREMCGVQSLMPHVLISKNLQWQYQMCLC